MKKITLLGTGMIGKTIAAELSVKYFLTAADVDHKSLELLHSNDRIRKVVADVTDITVLGKITGDADLVISAVPGNIGYGTVRKLISLGKNVVDISFMPEDVLALHEEARANKVTVVADSGLAPGLPNYITGYYNQVMEIREMICMVGGLPEVRTFPFEYKAPFSPADVIEEYMRPARFRVSGVIVTAPAMSDQELVFFQNVGTLEAFNTDGLRTLLTTMSHIKNMKEKTLRYPGHINLIKALQAAGFFSRMPLRVRDNPVVPLDLTSRVLFHAWKMEPDDKDFTVMRIILRGRQGNSEKEITYDLYDEYDTASTRSSMSRTTGYTATATAELLLNGMFNESGVYPPEIVTVKHGCFEFLINYLAERSIRFNISEKSL